MVSLELLKVDSNWVEALFLIDSGADRTVLSKNAAARLGLPLLPNPVQLEGVGGMIEVLSVETQLRLTDRRGSRGVFHNRFSVFTDDNLEMSVLGRDVMDRFVLILDRKQELVALLTAPDTFEIRSPV